MADSSLLKSMPPRLIAASLASVLLASALAAPAAPLVHFAFSAACHQDPARCFDWMGAPLPVCARCLGLYAGALAAAVFPLRVAPALLWAAVVLNALDWVLGAASNGPRFLMAALLAWAAGAALLAVASRQRRAGN